MFETHKQRVIPHSRFLGRMAVRLLVALLIVAASLGVGMVGYHYLEGMVWIDALLNASMILGGMGEITELKTDAGKIFASCYALYSGLMVIAMFGILLVPVFHRMLHRFHGSLPTKGEE